MVSSADQNLEQNLGLNFKVWHKVQIKRKRVNH